MQKLKKTKIFQYLNRHSKIFRYIKRYLKKVRGRIKLKLRSKIECHADNLMKINLNDLITSIESKNFTEEWKKVEEKLVAQRREKKHLGSVNFEDLQFIFTLVCELKPRTVLNIGTHIGSSTATIAAALPIRNGKVQDKASIVTVDIYDVNDSITGYWKQLGLSMSPIKILEELGKSNIVKFVVSDSNDFLRNCSEKFDFIFVDGSHEANMVYGDIAYALDLLNKNGVLLLHDYYPDSGPYLAIKKLQSESVPIIALPIKDLEIKYKLQETTLTILQKVND